MRCVGQLQVKPLSNRLILKLKTRLTSSVETENSNFD